MENRFIAIVGILAILGVARIASLDRKAILWRRVALGLGLQVAFAILILGIPALGVPGVFRFLFVALNHFMMNLVNFTTAGAGFVFGSLAEIKDPWGFVFAFRVLPSVIFFSAMMAGLYHLGVLQWIVKGCAWAMQKTLKTSGAETVSATANIFMGQTEAPLLIRPYISRMTQSEMFCVMVGGMATLAAGVEGAYIALLQARVPDIAGHLITASVMGAIGGLTISKMLVPETATPETANTLNLPNVEKPDKNFLEAVARGASEGIMLALNVAAMLIVFVAAIAMIDSALGLIGGLIGLDETLTFASLLGKVFQPVAWLLGISWKDSAIVGSLLGHKIVVNEFVGFVKLEAAASSLSDRTVLIATYALCGFANLSSIGIQIGGIGSLAQNQKSNIARLGLLAVLGGNLASFLSACIAALLF